MHEIVTFFRQLPRARQAQAVLLLLLMLVAAVLEIGGVVSVMPFLAVLGNPELVRRYDLLIRFHAWTGAETYHLFAVYLALAAFFAMVAAATIKVVVQYVAQRYIQAVSGWVSASLLEAYLNQPYVFFLSRNTAQMDHAIQSETQNAIAHVLHPALMICAYGFVLLLLFVAIVTIDFKVSIFVLSFLIVLYSVMVFLMTPLLKRAGESSVYFGQQRYRIAGEALRGVKTVKARGLESVYVERFREPSSLYTRNQALAQVLAAAPRHVVEALGVGAVMLLALYFMGSTDDLGQTLPLIGVYVLAGNRMLPAAQQIFQSFSQIRYGMPSLRAVLRDLPLQRPTGIMVPAQTTTLPAAFDIEVRDLTLRYPGAESDTLSSVSLTIPANTTLGIVGASGSGKTTLCDVLLGLLRPNAGEVIVAGAPADLVASPAWKRTVGYVPQDVYLTDASIAENIALGVPAAAIDRERLERVARMANIHDFIVTCPDGYATPTGERGVRLSGGQRQRLGIARALYGGPRVLVFDEATSALDSVTEREVMDAIRGLTHSMTIVIVAHRLQTVRHADLILHLDQGRVAGLGSYESLHATSPAFRELARYSGEGEDTR